MAEQTIVIHINGYWRDQRQACLAEYSGIFFVYEASYNAADQTVDLLKLIYIGEAENIKAEVISPENRFSWMTYLAPGHELCYACAGVDQPVRERAWAAYILTHKPPANTRSQEVFHYDNTTLVSTGKTALINPVVTARKNKTKSMEALVWAQHKEVIPVRAVQIYSDHPNERRLAMGK